MNLYKIKYETKDIFLETVYVCATTITHAIGLVELANKDNPCFNEVTDVECISANANFLIEKVDEA